jgi:hypothetical protein
MSAESFTVYVLLNLLTLFNRLTGRFFFLFFFFYIKFLISIISTVHCVFFFLRLHIPLKSSISLTYFINFSISCLSPFQISFVMSICSRFDSVSLQCHRMWSLVRFTCQKRLSALGFLFISAEWVALVYPVRVRLMTTCSRLVIVLVFMFILWCGLHSFIVVVEFSHFYCCSCSYFFI